MTYSELVILAMTYAAQFSDYPMPQVPPIIQRVSYEWIVAHTCKGEESHCASDGDYDAGVIYALEGVSQQRLEQIAVHDTVHHAQWMYYGRGPLTCEENAQWEGEAYRAEVLYTITIQHQPWKRNGVLAKGCQ